MTDQSFDPPGQRKFVESLQSPTSVVTYRAVVGFFVVVIAGLLGFFGSELVRGQDRLSDLMSKVEVSLATDKGRLDEQGRRLDLDETAITNLNQQTGSLDHRVTVIEAKQGIH